MLTKLEREAIALLTIIDEDAPKEEKDAGKRCKKCGTVVRIETRQMRSADEGMTTVEICRTCKTIRRI